MILVQSLTGTGTGAYKLGQSPHTNTVTVQFGGYVHGRHYFLAHRPWPNGLLSLVASPVPPADVGLRILVYVPFFRS